MKKPSKFSFLAGFVSGAIIFGGTAALAASIIATPSTNNIYVNNKEAKVEAYIINGRNYFQLRDMASVADFSVIWDGANNTVLIDTSRGYDPNETLPAPSPTPSQTSDIPGGTAIDYSLEANPAIFGSYYTREKYNTDRQRVLDTGEITSEWGSFAPTSDLAIEAANKFIDSISQLSELDKVYRISDFLIEHITYKDGVKFSGNDFWTSMAYGVCEQYSQMFRYMCYRAGIPCVYITGDADGNRHSWNEVYVDGKWQHYDGNLSDIRQAAALGEVGKKGHTYIDDAPKTTMYSKELYQPSSTK